jgi:hypothetical protein
MSLWQGRANHGPSDIPLHPATATKGNTKEGNIKTRNLAYKQTRINNETPETMYEIHKLNKF